MAATSANKLSRRGGANVHAIMPKIQSVIEEKKKKNNINIDLATAENWLIRSELIEICKDAVNNGLAERHLSYPTGLTGDPDLVDAFAHFFNKYFDPHLPVLPSHVATGSGASGSLDALLFNICDPKDGVLIPTPYWNGFDILFMVRSSITPVAVNLPSLTSTSSDELLEALERTIAEASVPVKALLLSNPHNPLGFCYSKDALKICLRFCKKHDIHFISDEVYALSTFSSAQPQVEVFTSILSLSLEDVGADPSRVHVVWSLSKDFGQSGVRIGCVLSQSNEELVFGVALAANLQISALSVLFVTGLLRSPKLDSLISLNRERLSRAYFTLVSFFEECHVSYIPCNAGLYVYARLAPNATSWEDESQLAMELKEGGVLVSPGRSYHNSESEKGWMRVGFAVEPSKLEEAIRRMRNALTKTHASTYTLKTERPQKRRRTDCFEPHSKRRRIPQKA